MNFEEPEIYDRLGNPISLYRWGELRRDLSYLQVARTKLGDLLISTVWLGLDHAFGLRQGPLIFETMVFDESSDSPSLDLGGFTDRYSTEQEAMQGHVDTVKAVQEMLHLSDEDLTRLLETSDDTSENP